MGFPLDFRVRDKESTQKSNADSNGSDGGCIDFSRKHHRLRVSELREAYRDQTRQTTPFWFSGCVTRKLSRGRSQTQNGSDSGKRNGGQMQRPEGIHGLRQPTTEWRMNPHHNPILGLNCMCLGRHMSPMKLHALHQVCIPFCTHWSCMRCLSQDLG
jgi:hypothetical protein